MRMSATYRNIFSLLQHSCAQHPAGPLHPIRLQTSVTHFENSPTLNYFRPHNSRRQHKLSEPWCSWEQAVPPLCQVCAHMWTNSPTFQERCQSKRLSPTAHPQHLLPGAHPFNQYVKSSVVVTLNIDLQGRGLPFKPFYMFCLSKMIMVTLKYYQQGNYRCWYFSLQDYFSSVLITFITLPKSVEFSQRCICSRTCNDLTFNQGNSCTLETGTGVEATGLLLWPEEALPGVTTAGMVSLGQTKDLPHAPLHLRQE